MFLGFDAIGFAAIGETPEDRVVGGGSSEAAIDWEVIIYAGTHEFITRLADTPADQPFKGTVEKAFRFDRSIISNNRIGESITIGLGQITLKNLEGDYDFLAVDHTPLGQRVVVRRGDRRRPYSEWQLMLDGYLVAQQIDRDAITFQLRDAGHRLDVPASPNIYAGTGGVEGGDDLKDKRKPRGFGYILNATPPLVIASALAYQINDGPVEAVSAVYVRGVAQVLDADYASVTLMNAASLGAGEYATCLAAGFIRIGVANDAEIGAVTCDFSGDKTGGTFVYRAADIVKRLLTSAADYIDPDDLVGSTFTQLNTDQPAEVGYYIGAGDDQTVAAAVGQLMAGIGGWGGSRRSGKFEVRRFTGPSGTAVGSYSRIDVVDVQTLPMPKELQPPPYRIRVGYERNWTVQTDLAGSITAARRAFLEQDLRFASDESAAIALDFPPGHELTEADTYFRDEVDALAEATRHLTLWGAPRRALYVIKLARPYTHELGDVIEVDFPRFDLDGGKLLRLIKIVEDDTEGTELVGFG